MQIIAGLSLRRLRRYSVLPFSSITVFLCCKFKMLPRSSRRAVIGPLDLNSKSRRKASWEARCQKQPISGRGGRIRRCDWPSAGFRSLPGTRCRRK